MSKPKPQALRISAALKLLALMPALALASALGGCASGSATGANDGGAAGKTFVITGASSGFGRGVALRLASLGGNVVLAARRTEALEDVARQVRAAGGSALVVTTDVSRPQDVARLARQAEERFGRIDVWINNAAVGAIGLFWDVPAEDHARVIDVNLKGVIYGSHVAIERFRAQGHGTLVNVGSVESEVPLAYQSSYAASKAAVLSLGRTLDQELRLTGSRSIKVATVMPWAADTPFWTHAGNYSGRSPRMVALDDPDDVVRAIVDVALHPREEVAVGWKASGAVLAHRLMPGLSERLAADVQHKALQAAPPASSTPGAVHEPMSAGTDVEGGVRERIRREDAAKLRQ